MCGVCERNTMSLPVTSSTALDLAMKSGNVQMQKNVQLETMELSAESKAQQEQHKNHMRKFNVSQRARSTTRAKKNSF